MTGVVVVSTHLDDAVLSAAVQLMRPGARLVTVCTGGPPAGAPLGYWDRLTGATDARVRLKERYAEDEAALPALGLRGSVRLGFPDDQHVAAGERSDHDDLVAALRPQLADASEVWAPAAIGCHPDHVAVRDATVEASADADLHYYADVPYSVRYGWPPSVTGQPPLPHLDVEFWLAEELAATGLATEQMVRTAHRLSADQQRRKAAAVACYATQVPALDYGRMLADADPAVGAVELSWSRPTTKSPSSSGGAGRAKW
jgi:LmbE family N-acetylglucosaminyl deacetylase